MYVHVRIHTKVYTDLVRGDNLNDNLEIENTVRVCMCVCAYIYTFI